MDSVAVLAENLQQLAEGIGARERAAAAETLVRLVTGVSGGGDGEGWDRETRLPLLSTIREALIRAWSVEESPRVRAAVRDALQTLRDERCRDSAPALLYGLIHGLASANRQFFARFVESLAAYATARRHLPDAAAATDPLQRIARVVAFCPEESQTHRVLRGIATTPACRRAVQVRSALDRLPDESHTNGSGDGSFLIESLMETALVLREGRDVLAESLRCLPTLPDDVLVSAETLAEWRQSHPLHLKGVFLAGANLRAVSLAGADLAGTLLIAADLSEADLRGADLSGADTGGARLDGCLTEWPSPLAAAPAPVEEITLCDLPPLPESPSESKPTIAATRPRRVLGGLGGLRGGIAAAARRATASLSLPDDAEIRDPFGTASKKGRLETINSINSINRAVSVFADKPGITGDNVQIRPSARADEDAVLREETLAEITEPRIGGTAAAGTLHYASGDVRLRDKALPKPARLTEADLLEITDLMKDR